MSDNLIHYDCSQYIKDIKSGKLDKIKVNPEVGMKVVAMTCIGIAAIEIDKICTMGYTYRCLDVNLEEMAVTGYSPSAQFYHVFNECIFEKIICPYAKNANQAFECTAPSDDIMKCR